MAEAPHRIGRYSLLAEIASGGMATVYLGRLEGEAGFNRPVAVKALHPAYAKDPAFVAMLLDEARIISHIAHPNVVQVLDVVAESGALALVMEHVRGASLSALSRSSEKPTLGVAVSIAIDSLRGLHAAHVAENANHQALEIVHRDVSPQNLIVGFDGICRVVDFGIAKALGRSTNTDAGTVKGKLGYMSPEQVVGDAVDGSTDSYAMAIVLWELLARKRLFVANSRTELSKRVHTGVVPGELELPDVPPQVLEVLRKALAKSTADRFASAQDFADALEHSTKRASSKEVGAWVKRAAPVEASALRDALAQPLTPLTTGDGSTSSAILVGKEDVVVGELLSGSQETAAAPRSRWGLWAVVSMLALGVTLGTVGWLRASTVPPAPVVVEEAPVAHVVIDAGPAEVEVVATEPVPVPAPEPIIDAGAPVMVKVGKRPVKRPPPPQVDCSVPWELDASGNRIFKRACLK